MPPPARGVFTSHVQRTTDLANRVGSPSLAMSSLQDTRADRSFPWWTSRSALLPVGASRPAAAAGGGRLAGDAERRSVPLELADHPVDFGQDRPGDHPRPGLVNAAKAAKRLAASLPDRIEGGVHARAVFLERLRLAR